MTTLIVDIEKPEDLEAVKGFLTARDLSYEVNDGECDDLHNNYELKQMFHDREEEYLKSDGKMVTPEESRAEIKKILEGKR